jgi:hypothetical protein
VQTNGYKIEGSIISRVEGSMIVCSKVEERGLRKRGLSGTGF